MPSLRGRVEQQVDGIAGSANKVISGVLDMSFGILCSFLHLAARPQLRQTAMLRSRSRPAHPDMRSDPDLGSKDRAKSILGDG
jgi:hypothetical protein